MPTRRHPVLLWPDGSGMVTAALVGDWAQAAAHASSAGEALRQLKDLLQWRQENEPWMADPDFADPALVEVKVEVRPQYAEGRRVLLCPETVWLPIPCVTGRQENGLHVAAIPHLGLRFDYQDSSALKSLVAHVVKEALHGFSPLQLAGHLPPRNCRLEEIVLREDAGRTSQVPPGERPELKVLFAVAEPVLHDTGRRQTGSAAFGREALAGQLAGTLANEKTNLLLVGEAGVGKSALLLDAVKRVAREKLTAHEESQGEGTCDDLRTYRFWRGSAGRMIAGMRYLGEWQERCEAFIRQLAVLEGAFCAENLLELVQAGGEGPGDSVGAFLLPYLQRGELRMVAEATPAEVEACRRLMPGLIDVFRIVLVPVFSDAEAVRVLGQLGSAYAASARIEIEPGVPELVHRLWVRFQPYAVFPGAAARFLRGLCQRPGTRAQVLSKQDVMAAFIKQTGLPEVFLRDEIPLEWDSLCGQLARHIIGQPAAIAAAARVVTAIKAGLADPGRPFGVLLFCGPTGVGKTALAKRVAEFCFGAGGGGDRLVRLDMSEFSGWGAARRLLQTPQGRPAPWIERVRQQPFCVVLFDEIEKAAPEVLDVLLGLLDEGRLTDRFGRVTQFRSSIIILTSNLGANAPTQTGFAATSAADYDSEVARFFRPEFFNRLDAVVTFNALSPGDVEAIARKELAELEGREGLVEAGLKFAWSDRLVAAVAREGYDRRFGARPLQRAIERLVATPLARWKLAQPQVRNLTLQVDLEGANQVVVKVPSPAR